MLLRWSMPKVPMQRYTEPSYLLEKRRSLRSIVAAMGSALRVAAAAARGGGGGISRLHPQ